MDRRLFIKRGRGGSVREVNKEDKALDRYTHTYKRRQKGTSTWGPFVGQTFP